MGSKSDARAGARERARGLDGEGLHRALLRIEAREREARILVAPQFLYRFGRFLQGDQPESLEARALGEILVVDPIIISAGQLDGPLAVAGLAEVHVARGESDFALAAVERAIATHRELKDPVREAEDLRIKAGAQALAGRRDDAEALLRGLRRAGDKPVDVILHTPGGSPEALESVVRYLRTRFDHIRAFVPLAAMSAGI